jgi:hypothetical protein
MVQVKASFTKIPKTWTKNGATKVCHSLDDIIQAAEYIAGIHSMDCSFSCTAHPVAEGSARKSERRHEEL